MHENDHDVLLMQHTRQMTQNKHTSPNTQHSISVSNDESIQYSRLRRICFLRIVVKLSSLKCSQCRDIALFLRSRINMLGTIHRGIEIVSEIQCIAYRAGPYVKTNSTFTVEAANQDAARLPVCFAVLQA